MRVIATSPKSRPQVMPRKRAKAARAAVTVSRDPLFNQSVEKAFAVLGTFSAERRVQGLAEIAAATQLTSGSA